MKNLLLLILTLLAGNLLAQSADGSTGWSVIGGETGTSVTLTNVTAETYLRAEINGTPSCTGAIYTCKVNTYPAVDPGTLTANTGSVTITVIPTIEDIDGNDLYNSYNRRCKLDG
jgi:hypothetical protein